MFWVMGVALAIGLILIVGLIFFKHINFANGPFHLPGDADLDDAQAALGFELPLPFRRFLKAGGDTEDAVLEGQGLEIEAAVVFPGFEGLYLIDMANKAWLEEGLPRDLLPFIQHDDHYFCVTETGRVVYCDHLGQSKHEWAAFNEWCVAVCGYAPYG